MTSNRQFASISLPTELAATIPRSCSWLKSMELHQLVQVAEKSPALPAKRDSKERLWLFGGSPRWWCNMTALSKPVLPLLGLMEDATGKVHLFQLNATHCVSRIQQAVLMNAVRGCPSDGFLKLRDIGLLQKRQDVFAIYKCVIDAVVIELAALLTPHSAYPSSEQIKILTAGAKNSLKAFAHSFEAPLDQSCLSRFMDDPVARYACYNQLMRMQGTCRNYHVQAMQSLPFYYALVTGRDPLAQRLINAIGKGQPLFEVLSEELHVPAWVLRSLRKAYTEQGLAKICPPENRGAVLSAVDATSQLDINHVPTTEKGWDYLLAAYRCLPTTDWLTQLQEFKFDSLANGIGLVKNMLAWKGKSGLKRQAAIIRDYLDYSGQAEDAAFPPPSPEDGLRQVWQKAKRWRTVAPQEVLDHYWNLSTPHWLHRELPRQECVEDPDDGANKFPTKRLILSWPALLSQPVMVGEYEFHELNTDIVLREEGYAMQHCVGGYAYQCAQGKTHIFSIRKMGIRVATMELKKVSDISFEIVQIKGPRNSKPPEQILYLAKQLLNSYRLTK